MNNIFKKSREQPKYVLLHLLISKALAENDKIQKKGKRPKLPYLINFSMLGKELSYVIWLVYDFSFLYFKVISWSCEKLPYLPFCSFQTNLWEIYWNSYTFIRQGIFQEQSQIIRNAELQISDWLFQSQST